MAVLSSTKKNKIVLSDYAYHRDVDNRLLLSEFSLLDVQITQEILEGSLTTSLEEVANFLEIPESSILSTLEKLKKARLISLHGNKILVSKEHRKWLEADMAKFEEGFSPGMEYLRTLLKRVPIEILPVWYAIPRTCDDIFHSIVEKYLVTPKMFHRRLEELKQEIPLFWPIWEDVLKSKNFTLTSSEVRHKYRLDQTAFEELMLLLEFNLVLAVSYEKSKDKWVEILSPFAEWRQYLQFLKDTEILESIDDSQVSKNSKNSFIEEMSLLLKQIKVKPIHQNAAPKTILERLTQLKLVEHKDSCIYSLGVADHFLAMNDDQKSHLLHRTSILAEEGVHYYLDRNLREIEHSLTRFLHSGWIFFDAFIEGSIACIGSLHEIALKKVGKTWEYQLPQYREKEIAFIKEVIFERLMEAGTVETGSAHGKECFRITEFGRRILAVD